MKKTFVLFLSLLLIFSATGCSALTRIPTALEYDSATHTPEPTSVPESGTVSTEENETSTDTEPTPTAEPTPEPTPEPPIEEINAALTLYHTLFETGLTQVSDGIWQLEPCDVLAADPATYSPHGYNPLYWMEGFTLYDINNDYIPELILESGEVDKKIYIFTTRNGKIEFLTDTLSGNQDEINYALHVYMTAEGEPKCFSIGTSGSGAGDAHFAYEITPDFSVSENFYRYDGLDSIHILIDGTEVDASTYDAEYEAYFGSMILLEKVPFTPYGSDPLAALEEAVHG